MTAEIRELGRAAWRRGEEPFPVKSAPLLAAYAEIPPGPGCVELRTDLCREWSAGYAAAKAAGEPQTDEPLHVPGPVMEITHTAADGTLLDGTSKGDGTGALLAAAGCKGWRFSKNLPIGPGWYRSRSIDTLPDMHAINLAAEALRAAGREVTVTVDRELRPMEESEAHRAERLDERVDRMTSRATRNAAGSDAADTEVRRIAHGIPLGQPILVGHHSEARARRDIERMDSAMRRSIELGRAADRAAEAAASAASHMQHREGLGVTLRRITRLEEEERGFQRTLDGHSRNFLDGNGVVVDTQVSAPATGDYRDRIELLLAEVQGKLRYWRKHVESLQAEGAKVWTPADFVKGDWVCHRWGWSLVKRVNKVSLTVPHIEPRLAEKYTWKVSFDEVKGRRSAEEHAALQAAAQESATETG